MYRMFMSKKNLKFVMRAIMYIATEVGQEEHDGSFWVCYGSFVLNQQVPESDIDLLYIHNRIAPAQRIQSSYKGHPVTIYSISRNDFASDGKQRSFGGYFSGKIFNPCVLLGGSKEDENFILKTSGEFISCFVVAIASRYNRKESTKSNLLADSVLARLHLCPWYNSYFLRYYTNPMFPTLWCHMEDVVFRALLNASVVIQGEKNFEYCLDFSDKVFHLETIKSVARFWALGSCFHGFIADFPDYYIQKSEQFIKQSHLKDKCDEMLKFIEQKAIGG